MPLASYAAYKSAIARTPGNYPFLKSFNNASGTSLKILSTWLDAPDAGSAPSTAVVCTASTFGALVTQPRLTTTTNPLYLVGADIASSYTAGATFFLVDRLSHQGGLSVTDVTAQTTNLPTAALTRYTSGVGVMAAIEIFSAIGTGTTTSLSISYTNQAGTAGRTTKSIVFSGSGLTGSRLTFILPLQDGDTGVRSVESVTLAGSAGASGNFGVVLFKPLLLLPSGHAFTTGQQPTHWDGLLCGGQKLIEVDDAACLQLLGLPGGAGLVPIFAGSLTIVEVA